MDQRSWDDLPAEVAGRASSAGLTIGGAEPLTAGLVSFQLGTSEHARTAVLRDLDGEPSDVIGGAVTACLSLIRDYLAELSVGEVQHA